MHLRHLQHTLRSVANASDWCRKQVVDRSAVLYNQHRMRDPQAGPDAQTLLRSYARLYTKSMFDLHDSYCRWYRSPEYVRDHAPTHLWVLPYARYSMVRKTAMLNGGDITSVLACITDAEDAEIRNRMNALMTTPVEMTTPLEDDPVAPEGEDTMAKLNRRYNRVLAETPWAQSLRLPELDDRLFRSPNQPFYWLSETDMDTMAFLGAEADRVDAGGVGASLRLDSGHLYLPEPRRRDW